MTKLEMLIESNTIEIADGLAWILLGKHQPAKGQRTWRMVCAYAESCVADKSDFDDMHQLLKDDPNAILFNGYECAWVGVDGVGGTDFSIKDVARRLKTAYDTGFCRSTHEEIDALMPESLKEAV